MALSTPTQLTSGGNSGTVSSNTTASISPTGGALLIACCGILRNSSIPSMTVSDTLSGTGSWTQYTLVTSDNKARASIFVAKAGATPGSGTITFSYTGSNPSRQAWQVIEITGQDTTTPVIQNTSGQTSGTSITVTLGSALTAGNLSFGFINAGDTASVTVGSGETEIAEATSGGSPQARVQCQYGSTNAHDWANLGTYTSTPALLIEIAQAVVAPTNNGNFFRMF